MIFRNERGAKKTKATGYMYTRENEC